MPIYEYKCERCDHQFEILQKISDKPASTCPACNADSLRKLMSAAAFKLKGTGWYETDFKTGIKKNLVKDDNDKKAVSSKSETKNKKKNDESKKKKGAVESS